MTTKTGLANNSSPGADTSIAVSGLEFSWDPAQKSIAFPDITLKRGDHLFLHGPSGSGKSTLLSLLAGMLQPATGTVEILGTNIYQLGASARDQFRADHMGVIFQQFNLVPYLNTLANVTLPCRLSERRKQHTEPGFQEQAKRLLTDLSIPEDHWLRKVTRLSIGQQQRIAAARALIGAPGLILADEPTSALDADNRDRFLELLLDLAHRNNTSVLFVSHDRSLARCFDHHLELQGGQP